MGGIETLTSPWQTQGKRLGYREKEEEEEGRCCEAATLC